MEPAVVLGVVVFISQPGVKPSPAFPGDIVGGRPFLGLLCPVQMPFPQIESIVAVFPEYIGDSGQLRGKEVFMAGDAVVGITAGEQGTPLGAAQGKS